MELVFVDLDQLFIDEIARAFDGVEGVRTVCDDVKNIPQSNTVFVSPCDMLLNMSDGIHHTYNSDMFVGIRTTGMIKLRGLNSRTALGRPVLPIGSAMIVPATPETHTHMLFAPTMFSPQDVSATSNAYHAFMAVLCLMRKAELQDVRTLVCPGMCTGVGNMSQREAANQMHRAFRDFYEGVRVPCQVEHLYLKNVFFSNVNSAEEQPNIYENTEIKHIEINDVVYR